MAFTPHFSLGMVSSYTPWLMGCRVGIGPICAYAVTYMRNLHVKKWNTEQSEQVLPCFCPQETRTKPFLKLILGMFASSFPTPILLWYFHQFLPVPKYPCSRSLGACVPLRNYRQCRTKVKNEMRTHWNVSDASQICPVHGPPFPFGCWSEDQI